MLQWCVSNAQFYSHVVQRGMESQGLCFIQMAIYRDCKAFVERVYDEKCSFRAAVVIHLFYRSL